MRTRRKSRRPSTKQIKRPVTHSYSLVTSVEVAAFERWLIDRQVSPDTVTTAEMEAHYAAFTAETTPTKE